MADKGPAKKSSPGEEKWRAQNAKGSEKNRHAAKREAERIVKDAQVRTKAELHAQKEKLEDELRNERNELKQIEKRLATPNLPPDYAAALRWTLGQE